MPRRPLGGGGGELKNPGREGGFSQRGRGVETQWSGGCLWGILGRGGALIFFFRGRNSR